MTRRPCCSVRRLWLPAMAPRCNQVDASQGSRASPPLVLRFCLLNALSLPRAFAGPSHMGPAGEAPAVVTEAQGWRLHLSSRSSTGYAGVRKQEQASGSRGRRPPWASGRFTATRWTDDRSSSASSTRRWRRPWRTRGRRGRWTDRSRRPPGARCARLGDHLTMEPGPSSHDCT